MKTTIEDSNTKLENKLKEFEEVVEEEINQVKEELSTTSIIKTEGGVGATKIQVPTYDGKVSWNTYLRHFEAVVRNWREEEKATSLIAALRGEALEVLRTIPEGSEDYKAVTSALEKRYGDAHLQHVYQAQLRNRKQRFEETLQQYEADTPRSLAQAVEIEAAKQASRETSIIRQVKAYHGKDRMETANGNLADIIIEVVEKYKKGQDSENSTMNRRRPIRCWTCGVEGHVKSRCPQPPTEQNQGNAN
ncbi:hypothetical protein NQ315_014863 [Exocentrus adspersus]|uniref:CCHC-type domain-containing protein n=1 Tax=Exocentrus adspersus TaxID=1586481 RepID=A0AAV8VKZ1_9CUCU|nr:hypothetical protein NQ315_014863 [Exocentrus adspersus]